MAPVASAMTLSRPRRGVGAWALISIGLIAFLVMLLFVGASAALLPWWFLIALSAAPIFLVIAWRLPEVALVLLVAVSFGLVPDFLLPRIPLAGGALRAEDLGLFGLFFLLVLRRIGSIHESYKMIAVAFRPIFLIFLLVGISSFLAVIYKTAGVKDIFNELRNYAYWLYLPLAALAIDSDERFDRFLKMIFALALLIAAAMLIQSTTGFRLTTRGQFAELWTVTDTVAGITRSTTPGMFVMGAALLWLLAAYAYGEIKFGFWYVSAVLLLIAGVIVGFGRGFWASIAIGFVILGFVRFSRGYAKTLIVLSVALFASSLIAVALKPELVTAVAKRVTSVSDEFERGTSVARRKIENQYAMSAFENSPIIGVGIGGRYKPFGTDSVSWEAESRYIHNTFLHAAAKFGLPGFLIVLSSILYYLSRCWNGFRYVASSKALSYSCFWVIFSAGFVTAFTQPNWMTSTGVLSISIAVFISERLRRKRLDSEISHGKLGK